MRLLSLLCLFTLSFSALSAQTSSRQKLIELGKAYHKFMFRNEPPAQVLKDLRGDVPTELKATTAFIVEAISKDNKLLGKKFLSLPDEQTLKALFTVDMVFHNLYEDEPKDHGRVIDSAAALKISHQELVVNYYQMLFTSIGNKNQPFDYSKVNFTLKDYGLIDETDAAIFYLQCIRQCNSAVWGYFNVVKPMNTKTAYEYINKFPRFNGQPYYQFTDFNFPDFIMVIVNDVGPQSYKRYYIDKLYELLLYHFICLKKEGAGEEKVNDLLLGSILREEKYYRYTSYKDDLEQIFQEGPLQYNKQFIDCENQWIALLPDSLGIYGYAFIYVDETGGLTLHRGGSFRITEDGKYADVFHDSISVKYRLSDPTDQKVALIPETARKALGLPVMPEWLPVYLKDTGTVRSLVRRGFLYNGWNRPDLALRFLERARSKDPHFPGLAMELAFAYNALGQYQKALDILKDAPEAKDNACYYFKEYIFAQAKLGLLEAAGETYTADAVKECEDSALKAEMAFNLAFEYHKAKKESEYRKWAAETRNWSKPGDMFNQALDELEAGKK